ncbi:MAG: DUF1015 domain-containing protein, partial [bacterium]
LGLKWRFVGGSPYTPLNRQKSAQIAAWDARGRAYPDYDRLNSKRLNPFHQLDLRVDKQYFFDNWSLMLYFDVQNVYDFTADDGVAHHFWVIDDPGIKVELIRLFEMVPYTYVADGHHRTAAAALVGNEKKASNPHHTGDEEYNFFLAVHFPDRQLNIIDYNRVVRDLNGLDEPEFLDRLSEIFIIEDKGKDIYKPAQLHNFSLYLGGKWYSLNARGGTYNDDDPIDKLDVTILSKHVFDKMLDIKDLRTDKRVDFVGGIRGLEELKKRVDSGEMKAAFALYPVSMKQLMDIADTGNIMPPKTTWFEPKLRSGLVVHLLD